MGTFNKPNRYFMFKSLLLYLLGSRLCCASQPIIDMLERIDKGASAHFIIETRDAEKDYFELEQRGDKILIRGKNNVSIASGLHWYLKKHANITL